MPEFENLEEYLKRTRDPEHLEREKQASKKFAEDGVLALNYGEHSLFGTPPDKQKEQPDKSLAELMSDEEILDYLRSVSKNLKILKEEAPEYGPQWIEVCRRKIGHFQTDLKYLEKIGRLPEEFKNFNVESL